MAIGRGGVEEGNVCMCEKWIMKEGEERGPSDKRVGTEGHGPE